MRNEQLPLYRHRIKVFISDLTRDLFQERQPLRAEYALTSDDLLFAERNRLSLRPIRLGEVWGERWQNAWFRISGQVPESWRGRKVVARINLTGEVMVYDREGNPIQGLTSGSLFALDFAREVYPLLAEAGGGEKVEIWGEAIANELYGVIFNERPRLDEPRPAGTIVSRVALLELAVLDNDMWQLVRDLEVIDSMLNALPPASYRYRQLVGRTNQGIDLYNDNRSQATRCRQALRGILDSPAHASALSVTAVGHAHIDTGWKWRVREGKRKCLRTFATQAALLERYPDYVFGASQAQHYAFVKERAPGLYHRIKQLVAAGRWEIQGGMWVEADTNLTSGESLIRQFIHGKNFFKDEFGVDVKNLWLPDVFGYSAVLPQIIKKSGCDYFLTQKLSWSQTNVFPHHTFRWRGLDGSEVITHFPPEANYNSMLLPETLIKAQDAFAEGGVLPEFLSLYGCGDGGGGPKEEFIEYGLRQRNLEGCPKVNFGRADVFFNRLEPYREQLAVWEGELYLEKHRGTFTTQARVKKANRGLETLLRQVECLSSLLPLDNYPSTELDYAWKKLLLNQFHDILPGSSIPEVYEDTLADYAQIRETGHHLLAQAAAALLTPDKRAITFVNVLSAPWVGTVELPETWHDGAVTTADGQHVPVELEKNNLIARLSMPSQSVTSWYFHPGQHTVAASHCDQELYLENELVRYEFNADAQLLAAFDKVLGTDLLPGGCVGNQLNYYVDIPNDSDAWDVDIFHENQRLEQAHGKLVMAYRSQIRQTMEFELIVGNSRLRQNITLEPGTRQLNFQTQVDWQESHRMLRVAFDTPVRAAHAVFDIQYGYVERPAHRNTGWDLAKFEVVAHRYADLSNRQVGFALLNDCKYGYKVLDGRMEMNLLRSPKFPDFQADRGQHEFTYAWLPHAGSAAEAHVCAAAAALNVRPLTFANYAAGRQLAWPCRLTAIDLSLEVIKKAEKENCLVVRIVETAGRHSSGRLELGAAYQALVETNLLEWDNANAATAGSIELNLAPFEIKTFKLLR